MPRLSLLAFIICVSLPLSSEAQRPTANAADWPWWRGPSGNGIANSPKPVATDWSETRNIAWRVDVPGRGHSSPVVVANRVILCTADESAKTQSVCCFDRATGKRLWIREVSRDGFPGRINRKNTHASSTVASDGKRIYATFLHHDAIFLVALDMNGQVLWSKNTGKYTPNQYRNGYASSPIFYGTTVVIACDFDGDGYLAALDRNSGKIVWKTPRPSRVNYASPVIAAIGGRDQLLLSGCDMVASYDPRSGKKIWSADATTMATAGTMVWDGDLVFASGGYPKAQTVCVKADGSGKVVWTNNQKCYEQSMLAYQGHIYALTDRGFLFCWDAKTGKEMWRERLRGPVSASPVLCNGMIYVSNEAGTTWVFHAKPDKFELVAKNQLGTESFASPAICDGQIFLRVAQGTGADRRESLVCIQKK